MTILGFGMASPGYWVDVVCLQQQRVRRWQEELAGYIGAAMAGQPIPEKYGTDARISLPHRIGIEAHYLVYAADHAVTICRRYQGLSGNDARISRALAAFDKFAGRIGDLRDWLAHFEDYAVGSGRQARGVQQDGPQVNFPDEGNLRGEVTFTVGTISVPIHALADHVRALVAVADEVWCEHVLGKA